MRTTHAIMTAVAVAALASSPALAMGNAGAKTKTVHVHAITASGVGEEIGVLTLSDSTDGLSINTALRSLPPGERGFHVHIKGDCGPAEKDGAMQAGLAAGGHLDPASTGKHEGPAGKGHTGDMPKLTVGADGTANTTLTVPRLTLAEAKGRAIIIHEGGDNYADTPSPLGGGGTRIACGVVD